MRHPIWVIIFCIAIFTPLTAFARGESERKGYAADIGRACNEVVMYTEVRVLRAQNELGGTERLYIAVGAGIVKPGTSIRDAIKAGGNLGFEFVCLFPVHDGKGTQILILMGRGK